LIGRPSIRLLLAWLALAAAMLAGAPALAHMTPNSEVMLDIGETKLLAHIVIPLGELRYALGDVALAGGDLTPGSRAGVTRYLLDRTDAVAPDGRRWAKAMRSIHVVAAAGGPDLQADLLLTPPVGASPRRFALDYAGVIDRVPNHVVLVFLRADYQGGHLSDHPRLLGGLQPGNRNLTIDQGSGSSLRGFGSAIALGVHHIAIGHDHLLFLFALLLPAPLLARGGRWAVAADLRTTIRHLVAIVTAFTIGHSATLVAGAFAGWQLPTRPVEIAIAVSILISAIHAWRPIFAGREPWVAGGFGLVHGMAFATIIGNFGLEPLQKAQSILGFNIGIELVQLGVVAVVAPLLVLMARSMPLYARFRSTAAALAGFAASAWIVERLFERENPVGRAVDTALGQAPWIVGALAVLAAISVAISPSARRTSKAPPPRNHPTAHS
jgi:hypothetical protein